MHLRRVKGKDSYFIGKAALPDDEQYLTEIEDQNNDSCLDGITTHPQRDPTLASQLCLQDPFLNSYSGMIGKLIDNNASLTNLLKCERNINKSLVEQNTMLQLRLKSLETHASENAQIEQKQAGLQSQATSPVNDSIVHMQATSSADKGKSDSISSVAKESSPTNCSGSAVVLQWFCAQGKISY